MGKLDGKVAIITGGASGLGRETCLTFSREGCSVVVADYNLEAAQQVADTINSQLYEVVNSAIAVKVDVSNKASVDLMVQEVIKHYGKIDILINNAGITQDSTLAKMTVEQWQRVVDVNLTGVFNCTHSVLPYMIENKYGRIINTSSIVKDGNFGQCNYSATKAGIVGFTKSLAREVGKYGITSNAVAFGFMLSPMTQAMPEKVLKMMEDKVPVKRLGTPQDAAYAYLVLAVEEASYISGTVLECNGSLSI